MRERAGFSASLRRITSHLLTFEEIGLDRTTVTGLLRQTRGLILVTGPTGSGKSTTLAAMVDWINEHLDRHIVTIEDPVEYLHRSRRSLITQREVGSDVPSFAEAMRRVLRQDPDVIMVGEMRDLETIATATTAAETGHLVLGTLHTTGSAKTVSRIIDVFPPNQQEQIRVQLAMSLLAVISQVLVPSRQGGTDRDGQLAAGPGGGPRGDDHHPGHLQPDPQQRDRPHAGRHPDLTRPAACSPSTTIWPCWSSGGSSSARWPWPTAWTPASWSPGCAEGVRHRPPPLAGCRPGRHPALRRTYSRTP